MEQQDLIIAVDPGKTTGLAIVRYLGDRNFTIESVYELAWENRFEIYWTIQAYKDRILAIVIEEFRLFNNPATMQAQINSEFPSVRVIEDVVLSAYICDLQDKIVMQRPADIHYKGKATLATTPEQRKLVSGSAHKLDALLHAKYYILINRKKLAKK